MPREIVREIVVVGAMMDKVPQILKQHSKVLWFPIKGKIAEEKGQFSSAIKHVWFHYACESARIHDIKQALRECGAVNVIFHELRNGDTTETKIVPGVLGALGMNTASSVGVNRPDESAAFHTLTAPPGDFVSASMIPQFTAPVGVLIPVGKMLAVYGINPQTAAQYLTDPNRYRYYGHNQFNRDTAQVESDVAVVVLLRSLAGDVRGTLVRIASTRALTLINSPWNASEFKEWFLAEGSIHFQEAVVVDQSPASVVEEVVAPNPAVVSDSVSAVLPADCEVIGQVLRVPTTRIRPFQGQPRTHFDPVKLKELAQALKAAGQKVPVIAKRVLGDAQVWFELVDGERRWQAAQLAGIETINLLVWNGKSQFEDSAISNLLREGLSAIETARTLNRLKAEDGGRTVVELAEMFGYSTSWVNMHLSLLTLHLEVQEMMDPSTPEDKRLSVMRAMEVAKVPQDHQVAAAKHIVENKFSAPQAAHHVRKLTAQVGVSSPRRRRGPDDTYRVFDAFLRRTEDSAERLLDQPQGTLGTIFETRRPEDAQRAIEDIERIMGLLARMTESIRSSLQKSKA